MYNYELELTEEERESILKIANDEMPEELIEQAKINWVFIKALEEAIKNNS